MYRHIITGCTTFLIFLVFQCVSCTANASELPLLKHVKRIVFLGDSITYAGGYVDYVQSYLKTHCAEHNYEIVDAGLPSETVSGLTEPGHAGGAFPRPVLSERLERVLTRTKPDLVFACYGMNDGIYYPFAEERFAQYRAGMLKLAEAVRAAGAQLVLLTPPPFDAVPIKGSTLPAGLSAYPQPYQGYDDVLSKYSQWLMEQGKRGWRVIDIHTPINRYLAKRRSTDAGFHLAGDGVHINSEGHWLIAEQILAYLGARSVDQVAAIDARANRVVRGSHCNLEVNPGYLLVSWQVSTPMPIDTQLGLSETDRKTAQERYDRRLLIVRNYGELPCLVTVNGSELAVLSRSQLASGISLLDYAASPMRKRSARLLERVHAQRAMLTDAWLTAIGHKRPGMPTGLAMERALDEAQKLHTEIQELAAPLLAVINVRPASP